MKWKKKEKNKSRIRKRNEINGQSEYGDMGIWFQCDEFAVFRIENLGMMIGCY